MGIIVLKNLVSLVGLGQAPLTSRPPMPGPHHARGPGAPHLTPACPPQGPIMRAGKRNLSHRRAKWLLDSEKELNEEIAKAVTSVSWRRKG